MCYNSIYKEKQSMIKTDLPSYLDELKKLAQTTKALFTDIDQTEAENSTFVDVIEKSGLVNKMPGGIAILKARYENELKNLPLKRENLQARADRLNTLIEAIEKGDEEGKIVDAVVSLFAAAVLGVADKKPEDDKPTIIIDGEEFKNAKENGETLQK